MLGNIRESLRWLWKKLLEILYKRVKLVWIQIFLLFWWGQQQISSFFRHITDGSLTQILRKNLKEINFNLRKFLEIFEKILLKVL